MTNPDVVFVLLAGIAFLGFILDALFDRIRTIDPSGFASRYAAKRYFIEEDGPEAVAPQALGAIFWLNRKTFPGSSLDLIATRRS
jgi:hypothetical protein